MVFFLEVTYFPTPTYLYGHNPTLQPVQLERPEVGGDVWRVGLAAEQVEAENRVLISQRHQ